YLFCLRTDAIAGKADGRTLDSPRDTTSPMEFSDSPRQCRSACPLTATTSGESPRWDAILRNRVSHWMQEGALTQSQKNFRCKAAIHLLSSSECLICPIIAVTPTSKALISSHESC